MEVITTPNGRFRLLVGDCLDGLRTLPDESVNCCVTSPPYWGLRDYGHDGQIGLEETPEQYVSKMVEVFREVRRVLRDDGTCWLNLGDSYAGPKGNTRGEGAGGGAERGKAMFGCAQGSAWGQPKQLVGIPWRVAFALQADGWWLRQDIIWAKPNPMPESVRDRCTKAHEYVFLLTKSERYYYDAEAVSEAANTKWLSRGGSLLNETGWHESARGGDTTRRVDRSNCDESRRNRRSVWTIATKPYSGAHFAVMPPNLVEPCILAGCPEDGVVLDPFLGSGTVAEVALRHGRQAVGCELNPQYAELIKQRIQAELDRTSLVDGRQRLRCRQCESYQEEKQQ